MNLREIEARRIEAQAEIDASKDQAERNRMGQFATPAELAVEILTYARGSLKEDAEIRFIDPAVGTGSFYSALLKVFPGDRLAYSAAYEIDSDYGQTAAKLWGSDLDVLLQDFTRALPPSDADKFNLLVCNPPYVRHHHIPSEEKRRLKDRTWQACGVEMKGLAGLYCYFIGLCHEWMSEGGLAGWLVPSEFMDVNYGAAVKRYLLDKVTLLHVHRFDPGEVQFGDALVSSSVVWFSRREPSPDHQVRFSYGGSLRRPNLERSVPAEALRREPKWTRYPVRESRHKPDTSSLSDFFKIKRGLVTGSNRYFILSSEEIAQRELPMEAFRPILPSPRYIPEDEIEADEAGNPMLERLLFLLDPRLPESQIRDRHPPLWEYLEEGRANGVADRYLCRHRDPWYIQENRPATPFLCTYLGRNDKEGRPFRFILNHSQATAPNVYLMLYPQGGLNNLLEEDPQLRRRVWKLLNNICPEVMLGEGRVYGGGLYKLEPRELGNVPVAELAELLPESALSGRQRQMDLFR